MSVDEVQYRAMLKKCFQSLKIISADQREVLAVVIVQMSNCGGKEPQLWYLHTVGHRISLPGCLSSCGVMGQTMPTDLQPYTSCLEEADNPVASMRDYDFGGTPPDVSSRMGSTDSF